jgi:hypothetical protein
VLDGSFTRSERLVLHCVVRGFESGAQIVLAGARLRGSKLTACFIWGWYRLPTGDFADTQTGGESIRLRGLRARQPRSSTQRSGLAQNCGAIAYAPPLLLQEDGIFLFNGVTYV